MSPMEENDVELMVIKTIEEKLNGYCTAKECEIRMKEVEQMGKAVQKIYFMLAAQTAAFMGSMILISLK